MDAADRPRPRRHLVRRRRRRDRPAHGTVRGRFERIEPHRLLSYRWARDLTGAEPAERSSTLVEFTLTPEGAGTRLRVVETGFAALAGSEEERARAAEGNLEGWGIKLRDIEDYLQRAPV